MPRLFLIARACAYCKSFPIRSALDRAAPRIVHPAAEAVKESHGIAAAQAQLTPAAMTATA